MYVTIENMIEGEKMVNLPFPVDNRKGKKEIAIIAVFTDNVIYESTGDFIFNKRQIKKGEVYSKLDFKSRIANIDNSNSLKITKLDDVFRLDFKLDELDNTDNIVNGLLSKSLLIHHVFVNNEVTQIKIDNPQYKKLMGGVFRTLNLRILDENGILMKNKLGAYIVLHIR